MDPSVSGPALAALGEDLFLLSIRPRDGKLMTRGRIDSGLMASELIRLAAAGRAWIDEGRIVAPDRTATGDAELDAALLSLAGSAVPPRPETWVGLPRRGIRAAYAARLTSAGALRLESSRVLGTPRYQVIDASRAAAARSRLGAVVQSAGTPAAGTPTAGSPAAGRRPTSPRWPWPAWPVRSGWATCSTPAGRDGPRGHGWPRSPGSKSSARPRRARAPGAAGCLRPGWRLARAGDAAGELVRESAAGGGPGPPSLLAMEEVIAATVHALTAVLEDGAVVASDVVGTRVGGIHVPGAHGAAGHGGQG